MSNAILIQSILDKTPQQNLLHITKSTFQIKDKQVIDISNCYFQEMENIFHQTKDPLLKLQLLKQMKNFAYVVDYRADKAIAKHQRWGIFQIFHKFFNHYRLLQKTAKTCLQKVARLENVYLRKQKTAIKIQKLIHENEKSLITVMEAESQAYAKSSLPAPLELQRTLKRAKQHLYLHRLATEMEVLQIENKIFKKLTYLPSIPIGLRKEILIKQKKTIKEHQEYLTILDSLKCLKLFYSKVMDKSNLYIETLQGQAYFDAIGSLHQDLVAFASSQSLPPTELPLIRRIITELEKLKSKLSKNSESDTYLDLELLDIPKEGNRPHCVLVPCGTATHAILCSISRQPNGLYSLTVINTGSGASFITEREKYYTNEIIYNDLKRDDLSASFFKKLFEFQDVAKGTKNMRLVNKFLDESLGVKGRSIGRKIQAQEQGTCTMSCLLAWLKHQLPKDLYLKFQVEMTQTALIKAEAAVDILKRENLLEKHQIAFLGRVTDESSTIFAKIFSEAEQVLNSKKQKLHKYLKFPNSQ